MQVTDIELLRKASHGDEAAFHELVDRHAQYLYGVAYGLVGNAADAEDVVQETLLGAFRGAAGFAQRSSVRTWLMRILVRQAALSQRRHRPAMSLQPDDWLTSGLAAPQKTEPATAVEKNMDVWTMLQTLSADHRQAMVLREMQGLSYEQIALVLNIPQGTVESRLHRARQDLKERFAGYL